MPEPDVEELLDRLTESVTVYDREGRLQYTNEAGARAFGRPRAALLGHTQWELVPSEHETPFQAALRAVLRKSEKRTLLTLVRPIERWYECDLYPIPNGALIVARDVTERQLGQDRLAQSEARFRALVEYAPEAIIILDPSTQSFSMANPAAERLFGLAREELLRRKLVDLGPAEQPDGSSSAARMRAYLEEAIRGSTPEFEWVIRSARGLDVPCEMRLLQLPQGDRLMVRGSLTDISSRKRMQEQLAQAQRLEAIGRLAGGIAHDFNNMMTVVIGTAESLLGRLGAVDPMRADLGDIVGAAERAALVTRQLLAFGRRQRLAPLLVDLSGHVENMNRVLHRILGEDIELHLDLARPLGLVRVDAGQIEQVILNLVVNARDAMPNGGKLTVETANVTLDAESQRLHHGSVPPGRYVMLAVSDTGEGMPEGVRSHIFEPFFTTKELGRGTGLGLATVHGIVEQSGGRIGVYSEPGAGTTFKVYLPRVDEPAAEASEAPAAAPESSGTETVLLVEDDAGVRQYVRRALERGGYTALEASNAGEALLIVEQHEGAVDLLLTDVIMPRMTGPQLAARLRAVRADLPAVYMSGYAEDRLNGQANLGPHDAFVQKPIGPDELLRSVRAALDGARRPPLPHL
jgi:PAS domain S-box-containing protein